VGVRSALLLSHDCSLRMDPTGEFSQQRQSHWYFGTHLKSAGDDLKAEMKFVREEAQRVSEKLRNASKVQTGLEILHYFILDLLGRSVWTLLRPFPSSLICQQRHPSGEDILKQNRGGVSPLYSLSIAHSLSLCLSLSLSSAVASGRRMWCRTQPRAWPGCVWRC
jgi:hypothetical protein